MVIGLKMVSKMSLKELNKALERLKEKSLSKTKQDSATKKRKGKEPKCTYQEEKSPYPTRRRG